MKNIKKLIQKQEEIKKELEAYYNEKIEAFKKDDIEKYNPYQATELPSRKELEPFVAQVRDQVWAQVRDQVSITQVRDQVWAQVRDQVFDQVWDQVIVQVMAQVRDQVFDQVWYQVWDQVGAQVRYQVRYHVFDQVWYQVRATSYWGVKIALDLPIKHWFFDFLKLGVIIVFMKGKVKVFGRKGMYLGEYDESEFEK